MTSSPEWGKWWQHSELQTVRRHTHFPPLGLYVTLYKAFLSASQAWCVYTALGAYPWHWVFEPRWHFRGSAANRGGAARGQTLYWTSGYQPKGFMLCTTVVRPGLFFWRLCMQVEKHKYMPVWLEIMGKYLGPEISCCAHVSEIGFSGRK